MRITRALPGLLLLLALCDAGNAADVSGPSLRVKPVLCIANRAAETCATVFQIDWTSTRIGNYCLASDNQREPLRCWNQAAGGEHRDNVVVTQDFYYWISEPEKAQKFSPVKVELLRLHGDDRRRERRSRHVWDVL
jgi:Protein of unknown function (DUF3019)